MGDEDHRRAEALLQPLELHAHLVAQEGVEVRERLVEQEHARLRDERAGQRHALLLAARQLARVARAQRAEAHEVEHALDARPELGLRDPRRRRPKATFSNTVMCGNSA